MSTTACTDRNDPGAPGSAATDGMVRFAFKGVPYQGSQDEDADMLSEVEVYHFKGEDFFLKTEIPDPYAESISLPTDGTTRVYSVSGTELSPEIGIKEDAFLKSTVSCQDGQDKASMFYSGTIDFSEENLANGRLEIEMKRGVARIDFSNAIDPDIRIIKIIVENGQQHSYSLAAVCLMTLQ